jgi:hypothetical protein
MKRVSVVLLGIMLHQFHASEASACSALPLVVSPLLPLEDATGVGTDAALIASSTAGVPLEFELAKADSPEELGDGGDVDGVELDVDCGEKNAEGKRYVCVAKPVDGLEPNANYVWKVSSEFGVNLPEWRSFRTSKNTTKVGETKVGVEIVEETFDEGRPCSQNHELTLELEVEALENPVVFNIPDVRRGPHYPGGPELLTEGDATREHKVWSPPKCFEAEVISVTGERRVLKELCTEIDTKSKGTMGAKASGGSGSGASSSCTASPRSPRSSLWWGAMAALIGCAAWRRRKPVA